MIKKTKTMKVIRITIITCMIILIGNIFDIASFRDCAHYYDKTPKLGKLYYYRVRAYKNYNGKKIYSKFSSKKSVRMTLPETDFKKVSIRSNGEVICTYKKLKNANGYYIYHSTDGKNFTRIKTVSTNTPHTSFSLNNLPEENYFKVRGYIRAGDKRY